MEADRTSLRFFDDSNVQQFSIINGVITTGTADSGARVRIDSAGLKAYNAGGINTVAINSDGSASFTGTINLVGSTLQGAIGGDNLIYNSGFELSVGTGYDGWQIMGGGTGSIVTSASVGVDANRTVGPGSQSTQDHHDRSRAVCLRRDSWRQASSCCRWRDVFDVCLCRLLGCWSYCLHECRLVQLSRNVDRRLMQLSSLQLQSHRQA